MPETPVILGVLENHGLEDEACAFRDGATCTTSPGRIRGRFNCSVEGCAFTSNYTDAEEGEHATVVALIAAGNYLQSQASGVSFGVGLPVGWESEAAGFGPEIEFDRFRGASATALIPAYACASDAVGTVAQCAALDVTIQANGVPDNNCDPASQLNYEAAVQNAWDGGLLPVIITHDGGANGCWVRSPADIPKAFSVGAVDPDEELPYSSWPHAAYSNRGPADVQVGAILRYDVTSIVDLVAAGTPIFVTFARGSYGTVEPSGAPASASGTSFAGPQVAATALL